MEIIIRGDKIEVTQAIQVQNFEKAAELRDTERKEKEKLEWYC